MSISKKQNVVLVDFSVPDKWSFAEGLRNATGSEWTISGISSNRDNGSAWKKMMRYMKYFAVSFHVLKHRGLYQTIVSWQQFYGIMIAWLAYRLNLKKVPNIIVMTFIFKEKKGMVGKVFRSFVYNALRSGFIKKVVCFSSSEPEYYAKKFDLPKELFCSMKFSVEDQAKEFSVSDEGYCVTAGRSNRDYQFLRETWKLSRELVVISDTDAGQDSENIRHERNCHGREYLEYIAHSHAVLVPLADQRISSGQLVALHAMMFGKPVIATENDTICDYVLDGKTGFIINKNEEELTNALKMLEDPCIYQRMSNNARAFFESECSVQSMGRQVGYLVSALIKEQNLEEGM